MFAPTVTGNAWATVSRPAPARGTRSDVVIELDCTMIVTTIPTMIPISGALLETCRDDRLDARLHGRAHDSHQERQRERRSADPRGR